MKPEQRRLLEMAGLLRRGTPDHLLLEGDEDPFADTGDDDAGGDDPFGDDSGDSSGDAADDGTGDDSSGEDDDAEGSNRIPPEELKPTDIKKFGSPRFLEVENSITKMFNDAFVSASVGAQELEAYPGRALEEEPTPAKDDKPEEEEKEESEEKEDKNESFYRYGSRRDKWLINEARRLLNEAESEGAAADEFDMEAFCVNLANYMDTIHNTQDIEAGIFNMARQMILNNFGNSTEQEFVDMLAATTDGKYEFLQTGFTDTPSTPVAVGASSDAAG